MSSESDDRERRILDSYKVVCICNKIRKGVVDKAIRNGAKTPADIKRMTRVGTGPCGAKRCGPVVRKMLAEAKDGE